MASSSGSPQRQITTRTLLHQEREVTSAIQDARNNGMAVAPSIRMAASLLRERLRRHVTATLAADRFATENQTVGDELEQMRPAQMHWEASVGEEVSPSLVQQNEAAHAAARLLQQEGLQMYDIQESNLVEERIAAERQRVEQAIREASRDEQRAVQRFREERWGSAEQERESYQSDIGRAAQQSSELQELLASANRHKLEQRHHAYGQHMEMLQQAADQQHQSVREQDTRMQYDIGRMKYEVNGLRQNRPRSSARGSDTGYHPDEKSDGGAASAARRVLHMTPQPRARSQGHCVWDAVGRNAQ